MFAHLIPWIAGMALVGSFVDSMLGPVGNRKAKERLAEWFFVIEHGDWKRLAHGTAQIVDQYLSLLFGEKSFSFRALLIALLYQAAVLYALLPSLLRLEHETLSFSDQAVIFTTLPLANALVDVTVLGLTRDSLAAMVTSGSYAKALVQIVVVSVIGMVISALAYYLSASFILYLLVVGSVGFYLSRIFGDFADFIVKTTVWIMLALTILSGFSILEYSLALVFVRSPDAAPFIRSADILLFFPASFSGWLVLFVLVSSILISRLKRVLQRPLAIVLDRLESAPKGVFAAIGGGCGAVVGFLKGV